MRPAAAEARRIVVKIGSSILTRDGELQSRVLGNIARQVSELFDAGREVAIVSSGAIAIGARELGWSNGERSIPEKQAAAAIGQIGLVEHYRRRFARRGRRVAQILVTRSGLADRERFINARHTLLELLRIGVVPIINENDTVATEEIRFGDNDNLSATVANLIGADMLIILTDVDGLYQKPPGEGPQSKLFDVVERVTPEIESAAAGSTSAFGRGGMTTKLEAAQAAIRCGSTTVFCNGRKRDVLLQVAAGEPVGTIFLTGNRLASRKHWLAFTTRTQGELVLDDGAVQAIARGGKSLLPAGARDVSGRFDRGDTVSICDEEGHRFAIGITNYSREDAAQILGVRSDRIAKLLGHANIKTTEIYAHLAPDFLRAAMDRLKY
ncbi:MAG: glutamate 5-kinase [Myxococcales bacterium]|nr:glutamate 5-kinase [Myxococcales bacterium]